MSDDIWSVVGGIVSGGVNLGTNMFLQDRAQKTNLEMWNRTNEYNSPQAQMERLKAAGLNPNLVYGHGAANLAGSAPQVSPLQAPDGLGEISKYQSIKNMQESQEAIRLANDKMKIDTINSAKAGESLDKDIEQKSIANEMARRELGIWQGMDDNALGYRMLQHGRFSADMLNLGNQGSQLMKGFWQYLMNLDDEQTEKAKLDPNSYRNKKFRQENNAKITW